MAELLRVYNDRGYDYGIRTLQGIEKNVRPGSFALLSEEDILYIESICSYDSKPFASGELRVVMPTAERTLEDIGVVKAEENLYISKQEIASMLNGKIATLRGWLNTITAPEYLHEIFEVSKELDLPASKIRLLKERMPEKNFVDSDE